MGEIMLDVDDAARALRLARAERDAVSDRVNELEERNWALLSEFEAMNEEDLFIYEDDDDDESDESRHRCCCLRKLWPP